MATRFMDARLLKAALTLLAHGERVEVYDMWSWQKCMLLGAGREAGTVRMGVWCEAGELDDVREFRFCRVPAATLERLEAVAAEQGSSEGVEIRTGRELSAEFLRALEFCAAAKRRRNRTLDGRFSDWTHRAEPERCG